MAHELNSRNSRDSSRSSSCTKLATEAARISAQLTPQIAVSPSSATTASSAVRALKKPYDPVAPMAVCSPMVATAQLCRSAPVANTRPKGTTISDTKNSHSASQCAGRGSWWASHPPMVGSGWLTMKPCRYDQSVSRLLPLNFILPKPNIRRNNSQRSDSEASGAGALVSASEPGVRAGRKSERKPHLQQQVVPGVDDSSGNVSIRQVHRPRRCEPHPRGNRSEWQCSGAQQSGSTAHNEAPLQRAVE